MGWSASSLASTSTTQSAVPFRVNGQLPIVTFNKLTVFGIRLYEAMSARAPPWFRTTNYSSNAEVSTRFRVFLRASLASTVITRNG